NDEVPQYLKSGIFTPKASKHTLSNAMDVGNPSNFERMLSIFNNNVEKMRAQISGYTFTDKDTLNTIEQVRKENHYMLCPHTAIAYAGLKEYLSTQQDPLNGIFLSSAHPCKFPNVYDEESWQQVEIPSQAKHLKEKEKQAIPMTTNYDNFKEWLMK